MSYRNRRFSLADPAPADVEVYGRLKFHREEGSKQNGLCYCKAWCGKSQKPYANYRFKTAERREEWIAEEKESEDKRAAFQAEMKAQTAQNLEEMKQKIQVGTLLHYSWGYDQTQCEYFEVVEKRGRKVILRRIGSKVVPDSEGFMSDTRSPDPGQYVGEPFAKMIGPWGISMAHGTASPCSADAKNYCSWYH